MEKIAFASQICILYKYVRLSCRFSFEAILGLWKNIYIYLY